MMRLYLCLVFILVACRGDGRIGSGVSQPFLAALTGPAVYEYEDRVYAAWQGPGLDPYVAYYDGAWSQPVRAGRNPLRRDDHGAPALIADGTGTLHLFYGAHSTPLKYATSPDGVTWTPQPDIGRAETYPNAVNTGDDVYLFSRTTLQAPDYASVVYRRLSDGWGETRHLIDFEGKTIYYSNTAYQAGRIWLAWVVYDGQTRRNLYAAYLDGGELYAPDGTRLVMPLREDQADTHCLVVEGPANAPTLHLDIDNWPHILYRQWNADSWHHTYVRLSSTGWQGPEFIANAGDMFNSAEFRLSAAMIDAYLITGDDRGGDLEHWQRDGAWEYEETMLVGRRYNHPKLAGDWLLISETDRVIFAIRQKGAAQDAR